MRKVPSRAAAITCCSVTNAHNGRKVCSFAELLAKPLLLAEGRHGQDATFPIGVKQANRMLPARSLADSS